MCITTWNSSPKGFPKVLKAVKRFALDWKTTEKHPTGQRCEGQTETTGLACRKRYDVEPGNPDEPLSQRHQK